jgi:hypothetical protein
MYVVGVDVGKLQDPAALATIHVSGAFAMHLVDLRRFPLHLSYVELAAELVAYARNPKLRLGSPMLVVDVGGVGEALRDHLTRELESVVGIRTIGAGAERWDSQTRTWTVEKSKIIGDFEGALRNGGLKVAAALPLAPQLMAEASSFKRVVGDGGRVSFTHRGPGHHGDLVIAAAMAYRWARKLSSDEARYHASSKSHEDRF